MLKKIFDLLGQAKKEEKLEKVLKIYLEFQKLNCSYSGRNNSTCEDLNYVNGRIVEIIKLFGFSKFEYHGDTGNGEENKIVLEF